MTVLVVAAAVIRDGRVLAARRRDRPAGDAAWEFPGGKVEAGEDERAALARECAEELWVSVAVGDRLGSAADAGIEIVLYAARLVAGEPAALDDHDELRWLAAGDLASVDWLPIDEQLLPAVHPLLRASTPGVVEISGKNQPHRAWRHDSGG